MAVSKSPLYPSDDQLLAGFAKALSHPARVAILKKLKDDGPNCVQIIAEGHPISPESISEHLKILKQTGLIEFEEKFPYTYYALNENVLLKAMDDLQHFMNHFGK